MQWQYREGYALHMGGLQAERHGEVMGAAAAIVLYEGV
jgi:hypothetical protein